jgi:hypothetical protein
MSNNNDSQNEIIGWENKWKCAVDMAAIAEIERDKAAEDATNYYAKVIELREELYNMQDQRDLAMKIINRIGKERDDAKQRCSDLEKAMSYSSESTTLLTKFLKASKDVNEWKNKAYETLTDYTLMEAKCFRLENQLKELNEHT